MAQGRRVRRVIRRIDPWSVLKVSIVFYLSMVLVFLLAGVLLWTAGSAVGAVEGVEKLIAGFGFQGFEFVGSQLLRGFVVVREGRCLGACAALSLLPARDRARGHPVTALSERPAASAPGPATRLRARVGAYVALTKPRIIELLLVTTVPTMVLAEQGMPSLWLVLATLVGGSLAAGSANALNCYYDRDIDVVMHRTSRRPLARRTVPPR
ncbi:MAG: DUF3566 domain-containing protein, partial [Actinobacteria bacterium]|nr:DUF3566 domain-containing protein [Actinomycetota bacterium]